MSDTPTSITPEMVETVARAICIEVGGDPDVGAVNARDDVTYQWQTFEGSARAVIKAMREPTRPMLTRGVVTLVDRELDGPDGVGPSDAWAIFTAMIDAALSETPEAEG